MEKEKRYLFPADYMADPSVHVFNDRVYIYPSHDWECENVENDNGDQYVMKDSHVLSTDDPMHGEVIDHGKALDIADIPWAGRQLWDSDIAEKDGKYYLYFPLKDKTDIFRIGVAVGDRPELPEGDQPALPSRVVKLSKDMLQFAEEPRPVIVVDENGEPLKANNPYRFFEASWVHKYNGKYYFSYSTGDTHMLCYAIGDNPYGPFTYQGVILTPVVGWTTHHSIVEYKGKWYLFHHDSVPSGGKSWLRSLKVCELEYDAEGHILTIDGGGEK